MDSRVADAGRSTRAIALRAVLVGALACLAVQLFASTHFYATAVFLAGLAVLVAVDIRSVISKLARAAERDLERLAIEGSDVPLPPSVRERQAITHGRRQRNIAPFDCQSLQIALRGSSQFGDDTAYVDRDEHSQAREKHSRRVEMGGREQLHRETGQRSDEDGA